LPDHPCFWRSARHVYVRSNNHLQWDMTSNQIFFSVLSNKTDTKGKFPGQSSETSPIRIFFKMYRLCTIDAYHLHEFVTFEISVTSIGGHR
jgi:hypothetical protein